ncbi:Phenylalanine racemase (ATP-hydrolyzing) [Actinobacteria bacterium OV320]|nr:Phenylalanine racemase (ATP-hydrolyzing) [Actinobacteria bacterium OV320]
MPQPALSIIAGGVSPVPGDVYAMFRAQAERHPGGTAVRQGDEARTYRELHIAAEELAGRLYRRGARPGTPVAVHMERGVHAVVALLAVLRLGATYVPLDVHHPLERSRAALRAAGATCVLVRGDAPFEDAEAVDLLRPEPGEEVPATAPSPALDDPAYILFTSGSTGVPKGARLPYRALSNLVSWLRRKASVGVGARTVQFSRVSFDVFLTEVLGTVTTGGELLVLDESRRADVEYLLRFCEDRRVQRLHLPFAALRPFAEWAQYKKASLPSLVEISTAGEQPYVTAALERLLSAGERPIRLTNQYGPTETHVVTEAILTGDPAGWPRTPTAGVALDNTVVALLDSAGAVVPLGDEGEVSVVGAQVGLGYLGPVSTAPGAGFGPVEALGGRWGYRTGDLGRIEGGELVLCGRIDDQVKISGHRVEPGEIEILADRAASLAEVAAVAVDTPGGTRTMALFVVPAPGATVDPDALRGALARRLPEAVVPGRVVLCDALPRTSTGKIDRRSLAERPADRAVPAVLSAPGPELPADEARIARRLAGVLGLDRVLAADSLLSLGGSSLQAMTLMTELAAEFGSTPSMDRLLGGATVSELAGQLRAGGWEESDENRPPHEANHSVPAPPADPPPPAVPADPTVLADPADPTVPSVSAGASGKSSTPLLPASTVQSEIWLAGRLGDPTAYNVTIALDIAGRLDRARLRHALRRTIARHPALRSLLKRKRDRIFVHRPQDWLTPFEYEVVGREETRSGAEASERAFADRPFDVGTDLPIRVALLRGPSQDRLVVAFHQHAVDAAGIQTVIDDLAHWYRTPDGAREGATDEAPDAAAPGPDPADATTLAYWRSALARVTPAHTTWLRREGGSPSGRSVHRRLELPYDLLHPGRSAPENGTVTRFARIIGTFAQAAHAVGAPEEFLTGVVTTRRVPGASPAVGCHLSLLPILLRPAAGLSDTVTAVHAAMATALSHRQISLGELASVLPKGPVLTTTFGLDDAERREIDFAGIRATTRYVPARTLQFPLALTPWTSPLCTAGLDAVFDDGLYLPHTVDALLNEWTRLLGHSADRL